MKRRILTISIAILITLISYYIYENCVWYRFKYTQEYVPGTDNIKGNVDKEKFLKYGEKFDIGANKNGYAVFKDPDGAFKEMKKLFPN